MRTSTRINNHYVKYVNYFKHIMGKFLFKIVSFIPTNWNFDLLKNKMFVIMNLIFDIFLTISKKMMKNKEIVTVEKVRKIQ